MTDEEKYLAGFVALLVVCVTVVLVGKFWLDWGVFQNPAPDTKVETNP